MRILMLGTGPFAVPTFREILDAGHDVAALYTSPLKTHRGKQLAPASSLRELAELRGVPIFDPADVNAPEVQPQLAGFQADLLVVCDYGRLLAPATLAAARLGGINLHASLLPKYRGAAPINWAIYNGEIETGATVIRMNPQIDAGPCIARSAVAIGPDETAPELEARLAELGARLVRDSLERLAAGEANPIPQDQALATRAPRLKKTDGAIDWGRSAHAIKNHIRAMEPWPKTFTFWHRREGSPVRLILGPASAVDECSAAPGAVVEAAGENLVIAAGRGGLAPKAIQPSGKRLMSVGEFLRGHRVVPGDRFGPE